MLHISVVHTPVNAIGKKRSSVFVFPKLSLSLICFGPSAVFVGSEKSGALVPTASAINVSPVQCEGEFTIETPNRWSKGLAMESARGEQRVRTGLGRNI